LRGGEWEKSNHELEKTPALKSPGVFSNLTIRFLYLKHFRLCRFTGRMGAQDVHRQWKQLPKYR
ncbi:hypothetical protein, partial [Vibrio lentus]|uniref:hypothetical protein n=1 Tax=Vibrio lentus TaxID=136468 RepID=UPI001A7E1732